MRVCELGTGDVAVLFDNGTVSVLEVDVFSLEVPTFCQIHYVLKLCLN